MPKHAMTVTTKKYLFKRPSLYLKCFNKDFILKPYFFLHLHFRSKAKWKTKKNLPHLMAREEVLNVSSV